jgi:hypothetical protein
VYFFIDRVIIPAVFHIERAKYLDDMNRWGQLSIRENITRILAFVYIIKGKIPFVNTAVDSTLRAYGNILLLPVVVFFIINVAFVALKKIPQGRRFLFLLAGIGVPLCIILLSAAGGSLPPMRAQFVLPLAFAFMFFFLIKTYKKKTAVVATCLALLAAAYQAQISAQLFYSDQLRYNEDVRIAYELNDLITRAQPENKKLPVAFVGRYNTATRFQANFLQGDVIGYSFFGAGTSVEFTTVEIWAFMKTLGMNFDMASRHGDQALKEAATIPPYPDPGCVKQMKDFIVVRLTENLYNGRN